MAGGFESVTIEHVAEVAGVSVSTVSRTINDKPDVAERTKEKVRRVMDELGYTRHRYASNLAGGLSRTLALLVPIIESGIRQLILDFIIGASKAAEKHDFLLNVATRVLEEHDLRSLKQSSQIDGAILMRTKLSDPRVPVLQEIGLPFVMLGRCRDNEGLSFVDLDFERAVELALEHVRQLGHRRVGLIGYSQEMQDAEYTYARLTTQSFDEMSKSLGLMPQIVHADGTAAGVAAATEELFRLDPEITAILTVYGELVASVERTLLDQRLQVPRDVSLIAMTEDKTAQQMAPALTSVTFPSEEMGAAAAEMLIEHILQRRGAPPEPKQVLLEPTLTHRETTTER